jgi:hypothetical protein
MWAMAKKYRVSVSFYHKMANLKFFKPRKTSYASLLCIIGLEYGDHSHKIQSFRQFFHQLATFGKIESQHQWILSEILKYFKTHKN